ncbi:MAG: DegT/DnrJ/EryC1/StrS family aminotransferase [Gammaproteobacteria bacterium]
MKYIPQIEPSIGDEEVRHITEVVRSTFITENRKTEEFLGHIKEITGAPYALAMSNGTLALVASLLAEEIGRGDEVVVPDLTFIASANAVRLVGAEPVFCDVDRTTGCIRRQDCEAVLTPKTRAIMPVHLYGQAANMDDLSALASERNLPLLEDAAEALGVHWRGRHVGTFGAYGVFSFFANKVMTCGEGGVVLTDSEERYRRLFRIKNHGRDRKGIFVHHHFGYNFSFTDLQAAIGVAQAEKFEKLMRRKRANYEYYLKHLADIEELTLVKVPDNVKSNYWFVNVLVPDPDELAEYLEVRGIGTRRLFYPMSRQPCYGGGAQGKFENADWLYEHGLSLPSGATLAEEDLLRICTGIKEFFV